MKKYGTAAHLENIVVGVNFSFLYLCNFFSDGDKGVTKPVHLRLQGNIYINTTYDQNMGLKCYYFMNF